jgi:hypothetical protein
MLQETPSGRYGRYCLCSNCYVTLWQMVSFALGPVALAFIATMIWAVHFRSMDCRDITTFRGDMYRGIAAVINRYETCLFIDSQVLLQLLNES